MNQLVITTAEALPRVYARDGAVFASSRDVAAFFGKRHDNVLRDIDALIDGLAGSSNLRGLFVERTEHHDKARKDVRFFDMTRDGFTLLAMGFTGRTALAFKVRYIEEFNRMEARLKAPALPNFTSPAAAARAWAEQFEAREAAEAKLIEAQPKVETYDQLVEANGLLTLTAASKSLGLPPRSGLIRLLEGRGVLYRSSPDRHLVPHQRYVDSGLFEVKVGVHNNVATQQTYVTPKGLVWLREKVKE